MKYILAKRVGDFPKTYRIKVLLSELGRIEEIRERVKEFVEEHELVLDLLEEAYVTSRYLDKSYSRRSAEQAVKALRDFKEALKEWL